jgi:hypothetical protein
MTYSMGAQAELPWGVRWQQGNLQFLCQVSKLLLPDLKMRRLRGMHATEAASWWVCRCGSSAPSAATTASAEAGAAQQQLHCVPS